ncbi:hypothetical protein NAT47_06310 [Flavobacterium sp. HXWNR69]|uniref:Uncharacterized protein n=1 Tax=Flavobacterium fragile TaxID=2949085 RepID=A0ABT0TGE0_9FLAO|nr:hypothetical protein [Flavobacterium sp. HXWNR69]MCL9770023.1 hypothetical protein [Flavobacterium sp. HXWNR69]
MKNLLIIIFTLISFLSYAQESSIQNDSISLGTCREGIENAESDFKKNIYNLYSYGLSVEIIKKGEEDFNEFYRDYMFKNYSINIENRGCVILPKSKCYAETAKKLIFQKFGEDIFERTRKEAKKAFLKNKHYR